ncbi:MAG: hypothetical protein A3F67_04670 [Verrucomicrobia bacterium RIFCSPHIGHO2_12_FULL_41_10]|nr:MAG: hypothetical protein A3F67_04670 [Verrucomicrobia bacterium RIFCSPHIGHO2_12_FULL_41_10]
MFLFFGKRIREFTSQVNRPAKVPLIPTSLYFAEIKTLVALLVACRKNKTGLRFLKIHLTAAFLK